MFIKYFDYLSPRVTFYHKGFLSHNSILSGILSIIAIAFIIILAVYYSLEVIERKDPNAYYFPTFIEEAGTFKINKSSLFHFLTSVQNIQGNTIHEEFDLTIFNIIGTNIYYKNYLSIVQKNGLQKIDHWLYGYCNKEINSKELIDLIHYDFFEKSICIQKFYNSTEHKYYKIGDPKFVWPEIAHGTFNDKNVLYNLIVQKCNNTILNNILGDGYQCKNDTEIDKFFNIRFTRIFHFYFINNYINILNYENPNYLFFYRLETPLYKNQFSANDLNFNPALIRTHNGLVLDNIKEDISYIFDRNDVYTDDNSNKDIYMSYSFFLKNVMDYYERSYKRIQDVISSIGGINQAITIIAIYLNTLYNNFVILSDTELLLHSSIKMEKEHHKRKIMQIKKKMKDIEKPNINENKNEKSNEKNNFKYKESKDKVIKNKTEIDISKNNNVSKTNNIFLSNIEDLNKKNIENNINYNINLEKRDDNREKLKNKKEKYFWNYLWFKITCGKNQKYFRIYENFRTKIISEEHLIRNHLNIYNLLKVTEKKRYYKRISSYQLKDLLNLI